MSTQDDPPQGVRVERFTPASIASSGYRGDTTEPGALAVACHTPALTAVLVVGVLFLLFTGLGLWSLTQGTWLVLLAMAPLAAYTAYLVFRAYRVEARLELDARLVTRVGDFTRIDVPAEEVRALVAVEAPEKDDGTAFAIVVELIDGTQRHALRGLRRDQARYVARLARAALGLDAPRSAARSHDPPGEAARAAEPAPARKEAK